ncbi:hypothetical protein JAAARDRAFT_286114 [Jaapia argillacea MUCL 33604]|uniref:Uncharacterized protein n=1 Tax=Jaapia argillacea MUCL 33604 TaxID=933084 RepID=A0A067PQX8_9AGAM|nr:hypothetical protein JAAARDRAFT_286114 [Jaapia argillacea MUCL 33604]
MLQPLRLRSRPITTYPFFRTASSIRPPIHAHIDSAFKLQYLHWLLLSLSLSPLSLSDWFPPRGTSSPLSYSIVHHTPTLLHSLIYVSHGSFFLCTPVPSTHFSFLTLNISFLPLHFFFCILTSNSQHNSATQTPTHWSIRHLPYMALATTPTTSTSPRDSCFVDDLLSCCFILVLFLLYLMTLLIRRASLPVGSDTLPVGMSSMNHSRYFTVTYFEWWRSEPEERLAYCRFALIDPSTMPLSRQICQTAL